MENNALRFDYGEITSITETDQGFLKIPGFATRTGVFTYRDAKGQIRAELRHPDDVFDPVSLESLRNLPVTLEHPPVMIDPENFAEYSKGYTTDRVEVNRDLIEVDVIVADASAIDAIQIDKVRELSCGYMSDLVPEQGTFNGARYNYRQKNIRYNHLAVVKSGRGGPEVRLRMDSSDAVMMDGAESINAPQELKKVVFMGEEVALPGRLADALQSLIDRFDEFRINSMEEESMANRKDEDVNQKGVSPKVPEVQGAPDGRNASKKIDESDEKGAARAKGLDSEEEKAKKDAEEEKAAKKDAEEEKKDAEEMKKDAEEMKEKLDAMQAKLDAAEAKLDEFASASIDKPNVPAGKMDSKAVDSRIRMRVKLERNAEKLLPSEKVAKFDSMDDMEIRKAVIKHRYPSADLEGKSAVYLETRFDSIMESVEGSDGVRRNYGRGALGGERMDSSKEEHMDSATAREKMVTNSRDLWKQPLSASKK